MTCCGCACTFTMTSSTTVIYMHMPEWSGEDRQLRKHVDVFDFWTEGAIESVDKGVDTEPLRLTGIELVCGDNEGLCFPLCFPICFSKPLSVKFNNIWKIQNNHEEVTIEGLGDCYDGVYVIRNFHFETVKKVPTAYRWSMDLEFVRGI